jgi:hypothetical protein
VITFDERLLGDDGELVTAILSTLPPDDLSRAAALSGGRMSHREKRKYN